MFFAQIKKQVSENLTILGYFSGILKSWRVFLAGKKFVEIFEIPVLVRDSAILRYQCSIYQSQTILILDLTPLARYVDVNVPGFEVIFELSIRSLDGAILAHHFKLHLALDFPNRERTTRFAITHADSE